MTGQYGRTLAVLVIGVGTFLVLHGISNVFLIGQFEVTFPRSLNVLGSGLLGFLAGFMIWSFASLVFCTTPWCENEFVKDIGLGSKGFEEARLQSYIVWWGNTIDILVVPGDSPIDTKNAIKDLLTKQTKPKSGELTGRERGGETADVNRPTELTSPNQPGPAASPEPNTVIPP
jgi:hypothetical protein